LLYCERLKVNKRRSYDLKLLYPLPELIPADFKFEVLGKKAETDQRTVQRAIYKKSLINEARVSIG